MKYARLVLLTVAGLLAIAVSAAGVVWLKGYAEALGYVVPPVLFIALLFAVLGGAFAFTARLCISEALRLRVDGHD